MTAERADADSARPTLQMRRIFDAPRPLLWSVWTKPEMMVRWWGPVEWPAVSVTSDFKVGGRWSATLQSATGREVLRHHGIYLEITPQERLVFTFRWDDGHEDGAPVETQVTVAMSDRPGGRTQIDFTHAALKSAPSLDGHRYGWTSAFGRLDQWIASCLEDCPDEIGDQSRFQRPVPRSL